jgi:transposase
LLASKSSDGAQVRRLLALALVLEGCSRTEVAEQSGMDWQTLRDWVHRYNDEGAEYPTAVLAGHRI